MDYIQDLINQIQSSENPMLYWAVIAVVFVFIVMMLRSLVSTLIMLAVLAGIVAGVMIYNGQEIPGLDLKNLSLPKFKMPSISADDVIPDDILPDSSSSDSSSSSNSESSSSDTLGDAIREKRSNRGSSFHLDTPNVSNSIENSATDLKGMIEDLGKSLDNN